MDRLLPELLFCIADFLKPFGTFPMANKDIDLGHDLLSLIKTCRRFYQVLVGYYYQALIAQLGVRNCFYRAVLKDSSRAMELIRDRASASFPMSNDDIYMLLESSIRFSGGYEPFSWLLTKHNEMHINVIKFKQCRLLYAALRSENERIMLHLFNEADDEDIRTRDCWTGETLLMSAVKRHKSKDIIRYLLQRGISMSEKYPYLRKTALHVAIEVNYLDAIEIFIEYDRQTVNEFLWEETGYMELQRGMFALQKNMNFDAVLDDDYIFRFAMMILDNTPDTNRLPKVIWGEQVLTSAINRRRWGLAQRVIQHGMAIDFAAHYNRSMVTSAVQCITHGEPDESDGVTTLKMLLNQGVHIDVGLIDGNTLLHLAHSAPVVKVLIDHGFDVNAENLKGHTTLHHAVLSDRIDIARLLVSHGADINCCNDADHETPLLKAVYQKKAIILLIFYSSTVPIASSQMLEEGHL
ncbi:hypothetical protein PISL3812_05475 [Talaromyces islandicus]|uniref:Uncharacterized protein n=1 Tax=Talaromyces islandicus TaxID=28573 RepID=A0A0U1LYM2_TALIS|nr:hypothetical protein PISL3812_05475 [Talaromyces islandicus]